MTTSFRFLAMPLAFIAFNLYGQGTYKFQPDLDARAAGILHEQNVKFKDLNKNGKPDIYEDWRQPVENRIFPFALG